MHHRLVGGDPSTARPAVADDQPRRDRQRIPAAASCDLGSQPPFATEGPKQFVHVREVRLEFDDKQGPPTRMPGEDVDDTALAVDRERDFGCKDPCGQFVPERSSNRLVQRRVPAVEESVEIASSPARHQIHPDVQGSRDRPNAVDRLRPDLPPLDPGDRRLGDAGLVRQILLAPTASLTDEPDDGPEPEVVHHRSLTSETYAGLTSDHA